MNVLFVTTSVGFGGAAKNILMIADELAGRGHKVGIFNLLAYSDHERRVPEQIQLFSFKKSWLSFLGVRLDQLLQLRRCSRQFGADVVVGFKSLPNFLVGILRFTTKIPTIMSERADPSRNKNVSIRSKVRSYFINRCDGGVFQLEAAKLFYGSRLQKKGIVIPNIVPFPENIPRVTTPEKVVISVGRFANLQKRYDVMLDAFSLFLKKRSDYVLKLYGEGEDEELIRKWIKEKHLESKAFIMGYTSQPLKEMVKAEIFLITSDFEGISNSLLEATSVGMPVVSTDSTPGGARSLIEDHKNGLLAPCGSPQAIADALCEYAENENLRNLCGNNAKKITSRFTKERICDMWENYFYRIVSQKS